MIYEILLEFEAAKSEVRKGLFSSIIITDNLIINNTAYKIW